MTRKHINTIALMLTLALVACSGSNGDDGSGQTGSGDDGTDGTDGSDSSDAGSTGETDSGTDGTYQPAMRVCGSAVADSGETLLEPGVQFCGPIVDGVAQQCVVAPPDENGRFCAGTDDPGDWNLKLVPPSFDDRYFSGSATLLTLEEGDLIDLPAPVVITEVGPVTDLVDGPNDVVIDDSLTVTLDPTIVDFGLGIDPQLAGATVDPANWAEELAPDGEQIVGQWAFFPFGIKATEGEITLTITSALDLEAGTEVTIHELDKEIAEVSVATTGTVNAEATGIDLAGGVHKLAWIIVTTAS